MTLIAPVNSICAVVVKPHTSFIEFYCAILILSNSQRRACLWDDKVTLHSAVRTKTTLALRLICSDEL